MMPLRTTTKEEAAGELQEFLDELVPRQEAADDALHNGDPEPRMELWSHASPVTVLGAFGVVAKGWDEVSETFRWVAGEFHHGDSFRLEVIAAGVSGDLAYTVGYEHSVVSRDGGPAKPNRLRVTHVYRRENGGWRIVHRHGDGLESNRVGTARS
jgi:ketosteroid isomerase-like protein